MTDPVAVPSPTVSASISKSSSLSNFHASHPANTSIAQSPSVADDRNSPIDSPSTATADNFDDATDDGSYTIKCICDYDEDDGNTIFCEACNTWQHIDCYYPDNRDEALQEDFTHSCVDCQPRVLDRARAAKRVAHLRESQLELEGKLERSSKSSSKKSSKSNSRKKSSTTTTSSTASSTPFSESKKSSSSKSSSSHRTSQSLSKQSSHDLPRKGFVPNHSDTPTPSSSPPPLPPDFEIYKFSPMFFSLHKSRNDVQIVSDSSFANLAISNTLSLWLRNSQLMKQETGQTFADVFQTLPPDVTIPPQDIHIQKTALAPELAGSGVVVEQLNSRTKIDKDVPLVELNGYIGFQKDYCVDPLNSWEDLTSPLPFVFFHPLLPLYIDTRKEGSRARYVRRSCRPNAVLDTYLYGGSEYHFWLVSVREISEGEQITIPWDFRFPQPDKDRLMYFLGLNDGAEAWGGGTTEAYEEMDLEQYQTLSRWLHLILSDYGGCACGLGSDCAFARFHRNFLFRASPAAQPKKKTSRPSKQNKAARAPSEPQVLDESSEQEGLNGANLGKTRDKTPERKGSIDVSPVMELSDREKRKVAMVEDTFRRLEQQQAPPRKKKRIASDGSSSSSAPGPAAAATTASSSTVPKTKPKMKSRGTGTAQTSSRSQTMDSHPESDSSTATVKEHRGSKKNAHSGHVTPRVIETRSIGVQTDPVYGEWFSLPDPARPRTRVVSVTKRLLYGQQQARNEARQLAKRASPVASTVVLPMFHDDGNDRTVFAISPTQSPGLSQTPEATSASQKTASPDCVRRGSMSGPTSIDGVLAGSHQTPTFLSTTTVLSAKPVLHHPFGTTNMLTTAVASHHHVHPNPVKKKLTLSDYKKSRMNQSQRGSAAVVTPATPAALATSSNVSDDKAGGGGGGGAEGDGTASLPTPLSIANTSSDEKSATDMDASSSALSGRGTKDAVVDVRPRAGSRGTGGATTDTTARVLA